MSEAKGKRSRMKDVLVLLGVVLANAVIVGILVQAFFFGE